MYSVMYAYMLDNYQLPISPITLMAISAKRKDKDDN